MPDQRPYYERLSPEQARVLWNVVEYALLAGWPGKDLTGIPAEETKALRLAFQDAQKTLFAIATEGI